MKNENFPKFQFTFFLKMVKKILELIIILPVNKKLKTERPVIEKENKSCNFCINLSDISKYSNTVFIQQAVLSNRNYWNTSTQIQLHNFYLYLKPNTNNKKKEYWNISM